MDFASLLAPDGALRFKPRGYDSGGILMTGRLKALFDA
jgi:hypothetical protein